MPPAVIDEAKGGQEVARKKTRHNYGYGAIYIRETKLGIPRFYIDYYDRNRKRTQKLVKNASNWQVKSITANVESKRISNQSSSKSLLRCS
jgi:hypothetical protein